MWRDARTRAPHARAAAGARRSHVVEEKLPSRSVASCHAERARRVHRATQRHVGVAGERVSVGVTRLFGVKPKTILVTGGARGIGLPIAGDGRRRKRRDGVHRIAQPTRARQRRAAHRRGHGDVPRLAAGLGTGDRLRGPRRRAQIPREQALHVLVNNSGTSWGAPMATHDTKGWDKTYNLNVKGVFFLTRELLPLLDAASTPTDPARVINIGSVAGIRPQVFPTFSYDVSKAAVHHLTRKLADELADRRPRVATPSRSTPSRRGTSRAA